MKIGITERGDAGLDFMWAEKMNSVNGCILITKNVNDSFIDKVLNFKDKVIVHATCTGHGGTLYEPNVPNYKTQIDGVKKLVDKGFKLSAVVFRVDPIIPTTEGIKSAQAVMDYAYAVFQQKLRFKISIIDMYPAARERFKAAGLPLPYGEYFSPSGAQVQIIDEFLAKNADKGEFECCSEPNLKNAVRVGCLSLKDFEILNISAEEAYSEVGFQRKDCLCLPCKTELLQNKKRCAHLCAYCYWKD